MSQTNGNDGPPGQETEPRLPVLDYAGPGTETPAGHGPGRLVRGSLYTAAVCTLVGLAMGDMVGNNFNRLALVPATGMLLSAAVYILGRIVQEEKTPVWCRWAMFVAALACLAMVPIAYASLNYPRRIPTSPDAWFWPALKVIGIALGTFAAVRVWLWVRGARWQLRRIRATPGPGSSQPPSGDRQ